MSEQNVALAREGYGDGDPLVTMAGRIDPEAEFDFTDVYPDQPVLRGRDEIKQFRDAGPWGRSLRFEPERYFDVDAERVLVFIRVTATGQESGAQVEVKAAHELTIRDGLLVRVKVYLDRDKALEANGLTG